MSDTLKTLIESLLMIGAISAAFVWYALVTARREDRNDQLLSGSALPRTVRGSSFGGKRTAATEDPDAHLGRCGAE
jgi:hypothetical protein